MMLVYRQYAVFSLYQSILFYQGDRGHLGLPGPVGPKGEGAPGPVVCTIKYTSYITLQILNLFTY